MNFTLSEADVEEVRRITTDQEAVGCVADPHSNCTGCRMVALARRIVLEPHDAKHSKKYRARAAERMEKRAERARADRAERVTFSEDVSDPDPHADDLEAEPEKVDLSDVAWSPPNGEIVESVPPALASGSGEVLQVETYDGKRFEVPDPERFEVPAETNGS